MDADKVRQVVDAEEARQLADAEEVLRFAGTDPARPTGFVIMGVATVTGVECVHCGAESDEVKLRTVEHETWCPWRLAREFAHRENDIRSIKKTWTLPYRPLGAN